MLDAIGSRELLLVLDNCAACSPAARSAAFVNEVLRSARWCLDPGHEPEGLRVDGEQLFTVPSLDDDASAPARRGVGGDVAFTPTRPAIA